MSVTSTGTYINYVGDASTVAFPFPFYLWEDDDLVVSVNGVQKVLTTDFTLSGTQDQAGGRPSGGTVTFLVAPASGTKIVIQRITDRTQTTVYIDGVAYTALSMNRALDKLTLLVQEMFGQFQGTLPSDPLGPSNVGDWYIVTPPTAGGPWIRVCVIAGTPGTWASAAFLSL